MTFAIHASKNGQSVVTVRISPDAAIDKARLLESFGWKVHITRPSNSKIQLSCLGFVPVNAASTILIVRPEGANYQ